MKGVYDMCFSVTVVYTALHEVASVANHANIAYCVAQMSAHA
jgi:hypothetical protein